MDFFGKVKKLFEENNNPMNVDNYYNISQIFNTELIIKKDFIDLLYKNNCVKFFLYKDMKISIYRKNILPKKYFIGNNIDNDIFSYINNVYNIFIIFENLDKIIKKTMIKKFIKNVYKVNLIKNKDFAVIYITDCVDILETGLFIGTLIKFLSHEVPHIYIDINTHAHCIYKNIIENNNLIYNIIKDFNNLFYITYILSESIFEHKKIEIYGNSKLCFNKGKYKKIILYNKLLYLLIKNIVM